MDHLTEAKKFIQRAQSASHKEVIDQHLVLADWYLSEAIKERDGASDAQKADQPESGAKTASARLG